MYFHLDDKNYKLAEVGVAVSDKIDKGYQIVKHFRPFGNESRDIGQFIDDDGTAYLIYESRPTKGFFIASLTDDYMDVKENVSFIKEPIEGGAIVHYEGLYYIIGSHLTGWNPNPNLYSSSKSLRGPWAEFKNIAPPETNTYNSQSTMLLKVKGKKIQLFSTWVICGNQTSSGTHAIYGCQWKSERGICGCRNQSHLKWM